MELFTDFVDNYKGATSGLNIFAKILVTLTLVLIVFAVISAIINVFVQV
ncbi:hypothetical protein [Christiangramia salexigens]|nr:hypothetical protein [Christiangramia salexigens]